MHKVVSMVNSEYFKYGKYFIETRHKINARFTVYAPDLTSNQILELKKNDIGHVKISKEKFEKEMMSLKFEMMISPMSITDPNPNELITFVDFDVEFIKDWQEEILKYKFDLGITIRKNMIEDKCYRAMANGGVIFCRNTFESEKILEFATDTMFKYGSDKLPEYDEIFKTLEDKNRPEHKRHLRTNLRCWTDQVLLSAIVKNCLSNKTPKFLGYNIECFSCELFNCVDKVQSNTYIKHLKQEGRFQISNIKENLLGA